jgi:hypothetical protein
MKETDGGQGRDEADDPGNDDQPPVVLGGEAVQNLKHDHPGATETTHVRAFALL